MNNKPPPRTVDFSTRSNYLYDHKPRQRQNSQKSLQKNTISRRGATHTFNDRRSTAKIRCSSHKLNIEAGRYANVPLERRKCQYCESNKIADVIEDEDHALHVCPIGNQVRAHLRSKLQNPGARLNLAETFQRKENSSEATGTKLSSNDIREIKLKTRAINNIYSLILSFKKTLNPLSASVQSSHAI